MAKHNLNIDCLECERDDRVLFTGLSFTLADGEIVQVVGPNGSGKTTLLRILAGLFGSYEGGISWCGNDIARNLDYKSELLYLGHKSAIKASLTVIENLRFLVGMHQPFSEGELFDALAKVDLAGYEYSLCQNLSAGQQRRVALARLYISKAKLWILDEVFTAIDLQGVAELEQHLALSAKSGVSILLTTHHQLAIEDVRRIHLGAGDV